MIEQIVTKTDLLTHFKEIGVQEGMILEVENKFKQARVFLLFCFH